MLRSSLPSHKLRDLASPPAHTYVNTLFDATDLFVAACYVVNHSVPHETLLGLAAETEVAEPKLSAVLMNFFEQVSAVRKMNQLTIHERESNDRICVNVEKVNLTGHESKGKSARNDLVRETKFYSPSVVIYGVSKIKAFGYCIPDLVNLDILLPYVTDQEKIKSNELLVTVEIGGLGIYNNEVGKWSTRTTSQYKTSIVLPREAIKSLHWAALVVSAPTKASKVVYKYRREIVVPGDTILLSDMSKLEEHKFMPVESLTLGRFRSDWCCFAGVFDPLDCLIPNKEDVLKTTGNDHCMFFMWDTSGQGGDLNGCAPIGEPKKKKKAKKDLFTIYFHYDGIFICFPLEYTQGHMKELNDTNFHNMLYDHLKEIALRLVPHGCFEKLYYCQTIVKLNLGLTEFRSNQDISDMLKVGYENGNAIDMYVEHFGYDIMEMAQADKNEEQNQNSIESSDVDYNSSDCEEIENVDFSDCG
ncbi:hypothetical protein Tco_0877842 [Tanacetum coccineum]|uniref:PB1-like domain-containing protein n=1 Tax=Tanacetum coccineum TaxID=301880 RepID=A0ABQ5BWM4_9ASTR